MNISIAEVMELLDLPKGPKYAIGSYKGEMTQAILAWTSECSLHELEFLILRAKQEIEDGKKKIESPSSDSQSQKEAVKQHHNQEGQSRT